MFVLHNKKKSIEFNHLYISIFVITTFISYLLKVKFISLFEIINNPYKNSFGINTNINIPFPFIRMLYFLIEMGKMDSKFYKNLVKGYINNLLNISKKLRLQKM